MADIHHNLLFFVAQFQLTCESLMDYVVGICENLLALWICTTVLLAFVGKIKWKELLTPLSRVPACLVLILWLREFFVYYGVYFITILLFGFGIARGIRFIILKITDSYTSVGYVKSIKCTSVRLSLTCPADIVVAFIILILLTIMQALCNWFFFSKKSDNGSRVPLSEAEKIEWLLLTAFQVTVIITILQFFTLATVFLTLSVPHMFSIMLVNTVQPKDITRYYPSGKPNTCMQSKIGEDSISSNSTRKDGSIAKDISLWHSFTKLPLMAAILSVFNVRIFKLDLIYLIVSPSWHSFFDMIVYVTILIVIIVLGYFCDFCDRCFLQTIHDQIKHLSQMQKFAAIPRLKWAKYAILIILCLGEMLLLLPLLDMMKQLKRFGLIMYVRWLKFKIQILNSLLSQERQIQEDGKALWYLEHMGEFLCRYCTDETPVQLQSSFRKLHKQLGHIFYMERPFLDIIPNTNKCNSVEVCDNRTMSSEIYPYSSCSSSCCKTSDNVTTDPSVSDESKDGSVAHLTAARSFLFGNHYTSSTIETTTSGNQNMGTTKEFLTEETVSKSLSKKKCLSRKHKRRKIRNTEDATYCDSVSYITDLSWSTKSSRSHESDEK